MDDRDSYWMRQVIEEANKGRPYSAPNPWVGCFLVKNNICIGKGYTGNQGGPHAEIEALKNVKDKSSITGSTAYVSLEPCCHYGKTSPCTEALIEAGVNSVVIALKDPDAKVQGKGIQRLQEAGIAVKVGIEKEAAKASLLPYLFHRTYHRPYIALKLACSLDARTAAADGSSQWITNQKSREFVHVLRQRHQGIMVGVNTANKDNPLLTVRTNPLPMMQPTRIIFDSKGSLNNHLNIFKLHQAASIILTTEACPSSVIEQWQELGCEVIKVSCQGESKVINLQEAVFMLGKRGFLSLFLEGGTSLATNFIKENLVQELHLFYGNIFLGSQGRSLFNDLNVSTLTEALTWDIKESSFFDNHLYMKLFPKDNHACQSIFC